jgi:hypothetical protein
VLRKGVRVSGSEREKQVYIASSLLPITSYLLTFLHTQLVYPSGKFTTVSEVSISSDSIS